MDTSLCINIAALILFIYLFIYVFIYLFKLCVCVCGGGGLEDVFGPGFCFRYDTIQSI